MLKKTTGFFSFLEDGTHHVDCDCCHDDLGNAGISGIGTLYVIRSSTMSCVCIECFNNGIQNYRELQYQSIGIDNCSICNKDLTARSVSEANMTRRFVCYKCRGSKHPDKEHSFVGTDTLSSFKGKGWSHCDGCGTLRLRSDNNFRYWSTQTATEVRGTPKCTRNYPKSTSCSHNYIFITDLTKDKNLVKKIKKKDVIDANDNLIPLGYEITRVDLLFQRCGYYLHWCTKCGNVDRRLPDWFINI